MSDKISFDYGTLPTGYYDLICARKRGIQSKWHHLEYARVRKECGEYAHHLDVGCGPGTFIGTMSGKGRSLGVDVARPQIEYAQRAHGSHNHSFAVMEPGRLPVDSQSMDVVTMMELVEHLTPEGVAQLLHESLRVLRPGGRLVLTTPNYAAFWPVLEFLVNRLGGVSYHDQHICPFRKSTLTAFVQGAGFTVELAEAFQFAAPFAAVASWKFADWVARREPAWMTKRLGHLLLLRAVKPSSLGAIMRKAA